MIYNTDAIMKAFEEGKDFEDIVSAFESAVTDVAKEYNEKQKAKKAKDNIVKDYALKAVSALFDLCDVAFPDEMKEKYSFDFKNNSPEEMDKYAQMMIDGINDIGPMLSFFEGISSMKQFLLEEDDVDKECCGKCTDCHCGCTEPIFTPEGPNDPINSSPSVKTTFFDSPKTPKELEDIFSFFFKG